MHIKTKGQLKKELDKARSSHARKYAKRVREVLERCDINPTRTKTERDLFILLAYQLVESYQIVPYLWDEAVKLAMEPPEEVVTVEQTNKQSKSNGV